MSLIRAEFTVQWLLHVGRCTCIVVVLQPQLLHSPAPSVQAASPFISRLLTAILLRQLHAVQVWRAHWDFQLYKAMEVQFKAGLENIHKSLPEVTRNTKPVQWICICRIYRIVDRMPSIINRLLLCIW
jgi:hypothetical protein